MITSADNPKIKQARALLSRKGREQQAHCLAEGARLVEDAMRAGILPALLFYVPAALEAPRARGLLERATTGGVPAWELSPAVFATLSDTTTSQGLLAVLPIPDLPATPERGPVLVLDRLRDPGNMGTILRSADAAGVAQVLASQGCVDPFNPKVLRAGMGSHFRLSLRAGLEWPAIAAALAGRVVWAADIHGDLAYDQVDWTGPSALIVGGETSGLSAEAITLSRQKVFIPMLSDADSLNAAMAGTVLLFESARQRRRAAPAQDCEANSVA